MNSKNLINLNTLTPSKRREIAKQGGLKSGKVRLAKSYNEDAVKEIGLTFDIERIKESLKYFNSKNKHEELIAKEEELLKVRKSANKKKNKYIYKYNSDIDEDVERYIKHLNRKHDNIARKKEGNL